MQDSLKKRTPRQETVLIAGMLAVVGGYLDAYTYILRGHVFANAQTGNIVLVAVEMAGKNLKSAVLHLFPIIAFMLGVFVTELLKRNCKNWEFIRWEHMIVLIEVVLLFLIGFIPSGVHHSFANVTISFICSMQVCSFRKVNGIAYASTMCTGNLRSATERLLGGLLEREKDAKEKAMHLFLVILLFVAGAFWGGVLAVWIGVKSVWVCCVILLIIFVAMMKSDEAKHKGEAE